MSKNGVEEMIKEAKESASDDKKFIDVALEMAKASEFAERYPDLLKWILALVDTRLKMNQDLTEAERNLLSVGYKQVIGNRRASFRNLASGAEELNDKKITSDYLEVITTEMIEICSAILDVLLKKLIPNAKTLSGQTTQKPQAFKLNEATIFYFKMVGDYKRYLAEVDAKGDHAKEAVKYYMEGSELAKTHLKSTHPVRLGLSLNLSVCHYEILKDEEKACTVAKEAFDDAIAQLESLDEKSYKDSTLIMQLLRDNLSIWTHKKEQEKE
mmetsp:Transcript_10477/g.15628  ORF Transcript_10477/g.15628 Transcript_10477/m.15628 type:complete len:270 (+) Transcript_10477:403-1212(+)|eukprot:CAMPEP_0167740770 /NCGR_PEP_ID=MMETSP0110_2-20121227/477_1 /TAXON_ID=629695 /ORGANISM="Gymnochlora sp., Strain CCMP2014" /LENGTH=269 /DNA_ID=CAMNT_0007624731 /DNA_START=155 /DNA_END=964 /DNA_ORIENTATION=+